MEERITTAAYSLKQRVTATVERVFPFGAFVRLPDGNEAYVRRRELSYDATLMPEDLISAGQTVQGIVVVLPKADRKLELSLRQSQPDPWQAFGRSFQVRDTVSATVKSISPRGVWVQITPGVDSLIPRSELAPWSVPEPGDLLWVGDQVEAMIVDLELSARRVRLSLQQQMIHRAQVHEISKKLRDAQMPSEPLLESEELDDGPADSVDLQGLGWVLVVDDDDGVREGLVAWLQRHGCQADGVGRPSEGLDRVRQTKVGLAIVDLDLAGQDGLEFVTDLRQLQPDTPVTVISIPEWIAEKSQDQEDAAVDEVFTKPLNLDEVADTLARLAQGETVGPFRVHSPRGEQETSSAFQRVAQTMRSGVSVQARLEMALQELVDLARAELGVLFHLDPISQQVDVVAQAGQSTVKQDAVYGLAQSPVKDLILGRGDVFQTKLSSQVRKRFEKLLNAVDFQSCVGVPVAALGRLDHALFLFHREPDAFSRYRLRDAHATATLIGVALESQALEGRIQAISPFLISGQLATGFGHDVFNKMSGLELQARNLRAACGSVTKEADILSTEQTVRDTEQLLETTLDLKETVKAFQELIRADVQMPLDVNQVAARSVALLRSTADRFRVRIETELDPGLPLVAGSPVRLQQAFLNVMLNAVQHTGHKRGQWPEGESYLRIATGLDPESDSRVCVRFVDSGPGIHRQLWDKIFALGFSTRPDGSGLGLFIARSLVESMAGQIAVEQSTIPTGTTFLIELPAAPVNEE